MYDLYYYTITAHFQLGNTPDTFPGLLPQAYECSPVLLLHRIPLIYFWLCCVKSRFSIIHILKNKENKTKNSKRKEQNTHYPNLFVVHYIVSCRTLRNWSWIRNGFRSWIRGVDRLDSWKKTEVENLMRLSL